MAKVTGPLFSVSATGRFGPLVFDRRGIVRRFALPTGEVTPEQAVQRERFASVAYQVSRLLPERVFQVRAAYGSGWYSQLIGRALLVYEAAAGLGWSSDAVAAIATVFSSFANDAPATLSGADDEPAWSAYLFG